MADTRTITIVIDRALDDELGELARSTGRDKQSLANEALTAWLEDQEDIRDARAILAERHPTVSLDEVRKTLGLAR
ncbi:MAG: type II toxin-antitoxin system RelB family antitoxin [Thermomicrobiales bacterium]